MKRKMFSIHKIMFFIAYAFFTISNVFSEDILVDNFEKELTGWFFVGDEISGGASLCKAEILRVNNNSYLKWAYKLQKTDKWEWCYATIGKTFEKAIDLSEYKKLKLKISCNNPKELININLVTKDKNLGVNKYSQYVISVEQSSSPYIFEIPLEKFRIVGWWKGRNKGYNPKIEFEKVVGIELSKSGLSGEKGEIFVDDIYFSKEVPKFFRKDILIKESKFNIKDNKFISENVANTIDVYADEIFIPPFKNNNGEISKYLYGTNWGMWLFSFPDTEIVKSLNVKVLRIGGNLMSRYNWRTSKYRDTSIGETYIYELPKIDEFVEYCKKIGAEPLIQINMLGYAPNEKNNDKFELCMDEKAAADLIYYLNGKKKYNVRFFEMDNEPCIWHFTHKDIVSKPLSIEEYFQKLKRFVIAMREVQSKISKDNLKIFAPAICTSWIDWGTYADTDYKGFEGAFDYLLSKCAEFENNKKENPNGYKLLDVLSFHIYPRFRINWEDPYDFIPQGIEKMLESTRTFWDDEYINYYDYNQVRGIIPRVIPRFNEWIFKYNPKVELAITEINVDSVGRVNYPKEVRPLFMAEIYGIAAKYGVDYLMQFCLNDYEGGFGMINEADEANFNYYVFKMFAENAVGKVLKTTSKDKNLSVYSFKDNYKLNLFIVNKKPKDVVSQINVSYNNTISTFQYMFKKYSLYVLSLNLPILPSDEIEVKELLIE
ncbi:MAG: CIA30 family protein [Endomicrobia bacterium]|nr:CIA30 family protein [Endomicrobiia bacterium]